MKKVYNISVKALSALHINGGVDVDSTRVTVKKDGKPYIPATLFKGVVRGQFSALLAAVINDDKETKRITEQFFGADGFYRSHTVFDNLISDGQLETETRTNVSINRYTRKALDGALVNTEVQPPVDKNGKPVIFCGCMTVHYEDEEMRRYEPLLMKAIETIVCIGSGKSRGLGFVEISANANDTPISDSIATAPGKKLVKFCLESDVMVGGVRSQHDENFLRSENVISGSVLRAAYANEILLDCPYSFELYDGKPNFIAFRGKEKCDGCANAEVCKKFSDMTFSCLTKEDSLPAPFTAKVCKTCGAKLMDTIAGTGELKCPVCRNDNDKAAGRMENAKGFLSSDGTGVVKPERSVSIHTAIDACTETVKEGSLFTIDAIKSGQCYSGIIDDCGSGMLKVGDVVYVGKFSSNGFGKLRVVSIDAVPERNIDKAIEQFNSKFGKTLRDKYGEDKTFAAILLTSDAKLDVASDGILSSEDFKKIWQKAFFGENDAIKLEQIYTQTFMWTGFDTALRPEDNGMKRKSTELITEKGTSVLVSFKDKSTADILKKMECDGIGRDTNIGYGQVMICSELHNLGV